MTPVLVIGGTASLQSYVADALIGRGREVALLDPLRVETLDAIVGASAAVLYLHNDGHERRQRARGVRQSGGGKPTRPAQSGWEEVRAAVIAHKVPCVSAAKGARKGKGTITEIRLPEVYGSESERMGNSTGPPAAQEVRLESPGPQGRMNRQAVRDARRAERGLAPASERRGPGARPRQRDPLAVTLEGAVPSLIDEFIGFAQAGRELVIERDGSKLVNCVLIDDLAEVLVDALIETETNGDVSKPIVFGDDQAISEIDAALLVARIAFRYNGGREIAVTSGKGSTRYIGHEHKRGRGHGDTSTLDEVGWSADRLTPLEEGVILTMQRRNGR